jgi:transcriptional regulator with XRE-family HTH domain
MIAKTLQALMTEQNINQSELARRAGLSQSAVSRIVNGSRGARLAGTTVLALADALKVDPRLLAGRPSKSKPAHK